MTKPCLRIATRQSPLALWQAHFVRQELQRFWPNLAIALLPLVTAGDTFLKDKLLIAGGKGLFVKELEEALLDGRADIAVHSMKDVPATFPPGLALPVICNRANPFDVLVSHTFGLSSLPYGAKIGTSSLRRQSQLLALRPDVKIVTLRGNINTRLNKLTHHGYDAIILAAAGLDRLSITGFLRETLPEEHMLPACGQGALGIECREDDQTIQRYLAPLHEPLSALCVHTERRVNAQLGGNCHVPLAVFCTAPATDQLLLRAKILSHDGTTVISNVQCGSQRQAVTLADACAQALLDQGGATLLHQASQA